MKYHSEHDPFMKRRVAATLGILLAAGGVLLVGATAFSQDSPAPFAKHAPGEKSLVVPDEHARLGKIYYILPDRERSIYFESNAPLEKIKGQSNKVIGYVVVGPDDNPAALKFGEGHLPVTSIKTGIDLRDEHLAGPDWLDAGKHPNIVFRFDEAKGIRLIKETSAFRTYEVTVHGSMSIHGVKRRLVIPKTTLTFLAESDATSKIAKGDLMAIRARFAVKLADHEVSHPVIGEKVANEVEIDTVLYLSTVPPAKP